MKTIFKDVRNLTFMGVMLALTIVFDLTIGFLPANMASAAVLIFVPTILTGIILGPKAGGLMGFCAGLVSLIHALTRPMSPIDPLFINPLVSVLPRIFIGVVAYYSYNFTKKIFGETIGIIIGGALGSLVNTILVISMLYLVYAQKIIELLGVGFKVFLLTIITTNASIECLISALLTLPIVMAYKKVLNRKNA